MYFNNFVEGEVWRILFAGGPDGKGGQFFKGGSSEFLEIEIVNFTSQLYLTYHLHAVWKMLYHLFFFTYAFSWFCFTKINLVVFIFLRIVDIFSQELANIVMTALERNFHFFV